MKAGPEHLEQGRTAATSVGSGLQAGGHADSRWSVVRRRVSLAGHVARRDGSLVTRGVVQLWHEAAVQPHADRPQRAGARGDTRAPAAASTTTPSQVSGREARIRGDGLYFYLDVPAGRYVVGGHEQRGRPIEARSVTVPVTDRARIPPLLNVDLVVEDAEGPPAGRPP